eukprot:1865550-Amphidinium_carterae.2
MLRKMDCSEDFEDRAVALDDTLAQEQQKRMLRGGATIRASISITVTPYRRAAQSSKISPRPSRADALAATSA